MSSWVMAVALTARILVAQPSVVVAPVSDSLSGIALVGPSDPAFLLAVQALIGAANFPSYEPALPYSVLVRNDTSRPIIDVCVIFDVTQVNGKKDGSLASGWGNIPPSAGAVPLLAPGAQLLASAVRGYAYTTPRRNPPPADLAARLAELSSAASIMVSLDSVLFADGTLAGPDTRNNFVQYSQRLAADRDLAAAVLSYQSGSVSGLQSYLDSEAVLDRSGGLGNQLNYIRRMAADARRFKMILARPAPKGGAAQAFASATALANDAAGLNLHK
jgi:hypothetical protein